MHTFPRGCTPDAARAARLAYATWAQAQAYLPVYWQPGWLDAVAPGQWWATSAGEAWEVGEWAWPLVLRRTLGGRVAGPPEASAYGGPWFPPGATAAVGLPAGCDYARLTCHQASAAWQFGRRCRALATQVVSLPELRPWTKPIRRLLRRGAETSVTEQVAFATVTQTVKAVLRTRPHLGRSAVWAAFERAAEVGYADCVVVREAATGHLQGVAVCVYDERRAYTPMVLRLGGAPAPTSTLLQVRMIELARGRGLLAVDLLSGYLPGVRKFLRQFGAVPEWYAQVRLTRGPLWALAEEVRARTNHARL